MTKEECKRLARIFKRYFEAVIRNLSPLAWWEKSKTWLHRRAAERLLAKFGRLHKNQDRGVVLVDAMWDNPNYWIRYTLIRAALGLSQSKEVGVLGQYRSRECRLTLKRFNISEIVQIVQLCGDLNLHRAEARRLLAETKTPDDILSWRLPHDFPGDFVYDGILKRQRTACVNIEDPMLVDYVAEALGSIEASWRLLNTSSFDLLLLSHTVNFQFASLAWQAVRRGIPVVLLYGNYGSPRYAKILRAEDIYDTTDRPKRTDIESLPLNKAEALAGAGRAYLKKRREGRTDDIGARYAYQKRQEWVDRATLGQLFGWEHDRPVIAVYASNWFDFPHPCGMTNFRDFLDWLQQTIEVATRTESVKWLFKAHPCDEWYGGVTLSDLMPKDCPPHVRLAPMSWNGGAILDCVDGLVTYHGTAGIEYAASGKPVLLADRGWYHDAGFAKWSRSRGEYLACLATDWWKELDLVRTTRCAQIFAGWYFCRPDWQGGFVLQDDTFQDRIYEHIPDLLSDNEEVIARELKTIEEWFTSESRHYHTFKMDKASEFSL